MFMLYLDHASVVNQSNRCHFITTNIVDISLDQLNTSHVGEKLNVLGAAGFIL